jgi:hypothetical protein
MDILDDEILSLWRSLSTNKVRYIMVGGFATNLHGFNRIEAKKAAAREKDLIDIIEMKK